VIDRAVSAIRSGKVVIMPTDTVYGLACSPYTPDPVERLSKLKQRPPDQPISLVANDIDMLFECVPELRGRSGTIITALLPGPYTLVLPNPAKRYRWLTGLRPDTIGVRVPELEGYGKQVLERVGAVAATSANLHGEPEPRTVSDIPQELIDGIAELVDAGPLPGPASTVIDFTGPKPQVLREGAGEVDTALAASADAASSIHGV
jgi:L-threonylcarbamoyladenylate synthase